MKQNQNGFSVAALLVILVAIGLIGFTGFYVSQRYKSTSDSGDDKQNSRITENGSISSATKNSTIDSMLEGVEYELLDTASGSVCSDDRDVCYEGEIFFLKMNYPVPDAIRSVATNLTKDSWLLDDGKPADSFLGSNTVATSDSSSSDVTDRDLVLQEPSADINYSNWSYFNPGFFGSRATMYRGNEGIYFFAFSKAELQTNEQPYYILQSELSVNDMYDFGKLLSNLGNDSYILSITLGKE